MERNAAAGHTDNGLTNSPDCRALLLRTTSDP